MLIKSPAYWAALGCLAALSFVGLLAVMGRCDAVVVAVVSSLRRSLWSLLRGVLWLASQ